MEQNQKRKHLALLIVCIGIAVAAPIAYLAIRSSTKPEEKPPVSASLPLSHYIKSDLPMLELDLQLTDVHRQALTPAVSHLIETDPAKKKPPVTFPENCPELIGGDGQWQTVIYDPEEERPKNCPKIAKWYVKIHPIAFSVHFQDAEKILTALKEDPEIKKVFESKLVQGVFYDALRTVNIRAEDIDPEGLKGVFLSKLITQALAAQGQVHYDAAHGRKGFVFSFVRDECPFAGTALPIIARYMVRSGFKVPKLQEPVLEVRTGVMRLFMTQFDRRIYIANGLESLLNVIESLKPAAELPKTAATVSLRGQAFLDNIFKVFVGDAGWEAHLGINFSKESPGVLQITSGKYARHLRPKIFKGVFAGIPQDVFGAVITSLYLPPDMTDAQWQELATAGPGTPSKEPEEAGVAVIWDLDPENPAISDMGMIIANQTTPEKAALFKRYFSNQDMTADCGGGTVFIAATSVRLLTRMRESCERQSVSILDWERGAKLNRFESAQALMFLNPGVGMNELFLAGASQSEDGNYDENPQPQWKQEYLQAKDLMRKETAASLQQIPIFAYAGNADSSDIITLKGFTVTQGESK